MPPLCRPHADRTTVTDECLVCIPLSQALCGIWGMLAALPRATPAPSSSDAPLASAVDALVAASASLPDAGRRLAVSVATALRLPLEVDLGSAPTRTSQLLVLQRLQLAAQVARTLASYERPAANLCSAGALASALSAVNTLATAWAAGWARHCNTSDGAGGDRARQHSGRERAQADADSAGTNAGASSGPRCFTDTAWPGPGACLVCALDAALLCTHAMLRATVARTALAGLRHALGSAPLLRWLPSLLLVARWEDGVPSHGAAASTACCCDDDVHGMWRCAQAPRLLRSATAVVAELSATAPGRDYLVAACSGVDATGWQGHALGPRGCFSGLCRDGAAPCAMCAWVTSNHAQAEGQQRIQPTATAASKHTRGSSDSGGGRRRTSSGCTCSRPSTVASPGRCTAAAPCHRSPCRSPRWGSARS